MSLFYTIFLIALDALSITWSISFLLIVRGGLKYITSPKGLKISPSFNAILNISWPILSLGSNASLVDLSFTISIALINPILLIYPTDS